MKIRIGFVSNSSSCAFIIPKKILSEEQIGQIKNHIEYARENFPQMQYADPGQAWKVEETDEQITTTTIMDNFDMHDFLIAIGVKKDDIEWSPF